MKFIFGMQRNSKIFYKLIVIFLGLHNQAYPKCLKQKICISFQHPQKNMGDEIALLAADKYKSFIQDTRLSFWVYVSRLAESTQNNKFARSLQYFKENGMNEVGFMLADNIKDFFKSIRSFQVWRGMPQLPKTTNLLFLFNIV